MLRNLLKRAPCHIKAFQVLFQSSLTMRIHKSTLDLNQIKISSGKRYLPWNWIHSKVYWHRSWKCIVTKRLVCLFLVFFLFPSNFKTVLLFGIFFKSLCKVCTFITIPIRKNCFPAFSFKLTLQIKLCLTYNFSISKSYDSWWGKVDEMIRWIW